jgi:Fibronectin type III-like domain
VPSILTHVTSYDREGNIISKRTETQEQLSITGLGSQSMRSFISSIDKILYISAMIQNSGPVGGTEIIQLYMGYPKSFSEPVRQLKGVKVVEFGPGESKNITFILSSKDLAVWDPIVHEWSIPCEPTGDPNCNCRYDFFIGASSRDLRLNGTVIMV